MHEHKSLRDRLEALTEHREQVFEPSDDPTLVAFSKLFARSGLVALDASKTLRVDAFSTIYDCETESRHDADTAPEKFVVLWAPVWAGDDPLTGFRTGQDSVFGSTPTVAMPQDERTAAPPALGHQHVRAPVRESSRTDASHPRCDRHRRECLPLRDARPSRVPSARASDSRVASLGCRRLATTLGRAGEGLVGLSDEARCCSWRGVVAVHHGPISGVQPEPVARDRTHHMVAMEHVVVAVTGVDVMHLEAVGERPGRIDHRVVRDLPVVALDVDRRISRVLSGENLSCRTCCRSACLSRCLP